MPLVNVNEIFSGGPPPDGIPPIDEPKYLKVADVDFLSDTEPVISLTINNDTRAFPVQIMTWHEIVNTTMGGVPVTVTYCPLCNSSVAYDRRIGDIVYDFGTSGSLYNSSLVMYDRQSGTLWTHFDGRAVVGDLEGTKLKFFPVAIVSFGQWKEQNPNGQVLDKVFLGGRPIRNYGQNPYVGYLEDPDLLSRTFIEGEIDNRLPIKELVIGVRSGDFALAIRREDIKKTSVINVNLAIGSDNTEKLVAFHQGGTNSAIDSGDISRGKDIGSVAVYSRNLNGRTLEFEKTLNGFRDTTTGSTWNILGQAIGGELAGSQLQPYKYLDTFWFAWVRFNPKTTIYSLN